jgi:hypothetical protein
MKRVRFRTEQNLWAALETPLFARISSNRLALLVAVGLAAFATNDSIAQRDCDLFVNFIEVTLMIHTMINRQLLRVSLVVCVVLCGLTTAAKAYTISLTGGSSGGNPGGQPLYEVSGLVQGDAFNVTWGGVSGLAVTGMVSIDALTATTADIRVMLDNMSTPISSSDPRVTVVGLDVDGYSSLASGATGGTYLDIASHANFPGFGTLTCGTAQNCAGGANGGIPAGSSDDLTLLVNGSFAGTLKLSSFALKVQGGPGGNSFELAGVPSAKVPEPTSIGLAAFGLIVLAVKRRSGR